MHRHLGVIAGWRLLTKSLFGHAQLAVDWNDGVARLARIAIAPELRGKGIAHDMLALVLTEAFAHPQIERVELNVFSWNERPSRRTRAWASRTKEQPSSVKVGAERWDTAMMGQLRAEWEHGPLAKPSDLVTSLSRPSPLDPEMWLTP